MKFSQRILRSRRRVLQSLMPNEHPDNHCHFIIDIFLLQDIYYEVAEDRVIQSYFYQIDKGALPEVRSIF